MTLLSSLFGAKAQDTETIKILNAEGFSTAITADKVQLVDVRTAKEFNEGVIGNALNIDFFQKEVFTDEFNKLDKEQPVYLYCRSGNAVSRQPKSWIL